MGMDTDPSWRWKLEDFTKSSVLIFVLHFLLSVNAASLSELEKTLATPNPVLITPSNYNDVHLFVQDYKELDTQEQPKVKRQTDSSNHEIFRNPTISLWESFKKGYNQQKLGNQNEHEPIKIQSQQTNQTSSSEKNTTLITTKPKRRLSNNTSSLSKLKSLTSTTESSIWAPWKELLSKAKVNNPDSSIDNNLKKNVKSHRADHDNIEYTDQVQQESNPTAVISHALTATQAVKGKLLSRSLKFLWNVKKNLLGVISLNHLHGKLHKPQVQQSSLHDLLIKPWSLISQVTKEPSHWDVQPPKDSPSPWAVQSTQKPWNIWTAPVSKPELDLPIIHVPLQITDNSPIHQFKNALWDSVPLKHSLLWKAKENLIPLIMQTKANGVSHILKTIANKEHSHVYLLLKIVNNALWKGKKAFIRQLLNLQNKLTKHKKQAATTQESYYGSGQEVQHIELTSTPSPSGYIGSSHSDSYYPSFGQTLTSSSDSSGGLVNVNSYSIPRSNAKSETTGHYHPTLSSTPRQNIFYAYTNSHQPQYTQLASASNYGGKIVLPQAFSARPKFASTAYLERSTQKENKPSFGTKLLQLRLVNDEKKAS